MNNKEKIKQEIKRKGGEMITTTRVWNIDNQLVVADTIEEAIAIRKEYDKDYYDHNEVNHAKSVVVDNGITTITLAVKRI